MACPARVTYCPLCRLPLSPEEIATAPANEYPTHYACRVAHQAWIEALDAEEQEREYRHATKRSAIRLA